MKTLFGCGIAIIDATSLDTLWALKMDNTTGYINQPAQVDETSLYLLDSGGTLHIFEKDNQNN